MMSSQASYEMKEGSGGQSKQKENLAIRLTISEQIEQHHQRCNEALSGDNILALQETIIAYRESLKSEIDRCLRLEGRLPYFDAKYQEVHPLVLREFKETIISHIFSLATFISFLMKKMETDIGLLSLDMFQYWGQSLVASRIEQCVMNEEDIARRHQEDIDLVSSLERHHLDTRRRTAEQLLVSAIAFPVGFALGGPVGGAVAVSCSLTPFKIIDTIKKHKLKISDVSSKEKMADLQKNLFEEAVISIHSLSLSAIRDFVISGTRDSLTERSISEKLVDAHTSLWDLLINQAIGNFEQAIKEDLCERSTKIISTSEKQSLSVLLHNIADSFLSDTDRLAFFSRCEKPLEDFKRHLNTTVQAFNDENKSRETDINRLLDSFEQRVTETQHESRRLHHVFKKMKAWAVTFYFDPARCDQKRITINPENDLLESTSFKTSDIISEGIDIAGNEKPAQLKIESRSQGLAEDCDHLLFRYTEARAYADELYESTVIIHRELPGYLSREKTQEANLVLLREKASIWESWQEKIIASLPGRKSIDRHPPHSPGAEEPIVSAASPVHEESQERSKKQISRDITGSKSTIFTVSADRTDVDKKKPKGGQPCIQAVV